MSIVVNEKIGSRTLQRAALTSPTGKREFVVYETDTTTDKPLLAMLALRAEGVPQMGDSHPDERRMTLINHEVTADTNSNYVQNIVCSYAVQGLDGGGSYTALSTNVRGVHNDYFRNLPIPPDYNLGDNNNGVGLEDIGGFPVDIAGKPVTIGTFQQTIDIRSPFANKPNFNVIRNLTNTRNATMWDGFPVGMLLYLGASASVTNGNIWTTTHKFAADETYHAKQLAVREEDGKVKMQLNPDTGIIQATHVIWVQPFPFLKNFGLLGLGNIP